KVPSSCALPAAPCRSRVACRQQSLGLPARPWPLTRTGACSSRSLVRHTMGRTYHRLRPRLLLVRHNQPDSREGYFLVVFPLLIKLGAKLLSANRLSQSAASAPGALTPYVISIPALCLPGCDHNTTTTENREGDRNCAGGPLKGS